MNEFALKLGTPRRSASPLIDHFATNCQAADNGPELISGDLDLGAYHRGVVLDFSRPGKSTDNAFIEAFIGKFRQECLNAHWFLSLADAAEKLEAWPLSAMQASPAGQR